MKDLIKHLKIMKYIVFYVQKKDKKIVPELQISNQAKFYNSYFFFFVYHGVEKREKLTSD